MTTVETATTQLGQLLAKSDTNWGAVMTALLKVREETLGEIEQESAAKPVPTPVTLTTDERTALSRLDDLLDVTKWPTQRKELTARQRETLLDLLGDEKTLKKLLERIEDAVKLAAWNHFDVEAERAGTASEDTPTDKWGFYALKGTFSDPDTGLEIERRVTPGKPILTVKALEKLECEGVITHQEFLNMTVGVRVLDEGKATAALAKDPTLGRRVAEAIEYSTAKNALILNRK